MIFLLQIGCDTRHFMIFYLFERRSEEKDNVRIDVRIDFKSNNAQAR